MKIWLATYHDDDSASGTAQVWGTSQRKVRKLLADAKANGASNFFVHSCMALEVPTTREALVDFLNSWANAAGDAR